MPWKWKNGKDIEILRNELSSSLNGECALFYSGREALFAILKSLNLKDNDEVIIQGYTCSVVPNAIRAAKGKPVFADIDLNSLNLTKESVEEKISENTRAVICQHTFGLSADASSLRKLCDVRNIILIEDCAHIIPDKYENSSIGKYGDAAFFSFGRDKSISGVTGGAVITRNPILSKEISTQEQNATHVSVYTIFKLLNYPIIYFICKPLYGIKIGKMLLWLAGKIGLLVPYVTNKEKNGKMPPFLHKLPNACASLTYYQLKNIENLNNHRRKLTSFYLSIIKEKGISFPHSINENMALLKFPIFTNSANKIREEMKKHNIYLEDGWTSAVICPKTTNNIALGYQKGTCPEAEKVAKNILTLPTHPTMTLKQAKRLMNLLIKRYQGK